MNFLRLCSGLSQIKAQLVHDPLTAGAKYEARYRLLSRDLEAGPSREALCATRLDNPEDPNQSMEGVSHDLTMVVQHRSGINAP